MGVRGRGRGRRSGAGRGRAGSRGRWARDRVCRRCRSSRRECCRSVGRAHDALCSAGCVHVCASSACPRRSAGRGSGHRPGRSLRVAHLAARTSGRVGRVRTRMARPRHGGGRSKGKGRAEGTSAGERAETSRAAAVRSTHSVDRSIDRSGQHNATRLGLVHKGGEQRATRRCSRKQSGEAARIRLPSLPPLRFRRAASQPRRGMQMEVG